jgi:beta-glucanase (GH16 family)
MKTLTNFFLSASFVMAFVACDKAQVAQPNPNVPPIDPAPLQGFSTTSCGTNQVEMDMTNAGWKKVWQEDFESNLSKWDIWTGGAYNNELQHYQESNLAIKDGMLKITPARLTITGKTTPFENTQKLFDFTSGRIESKEYFTPSGSNDYKSVRFAARVRTSEGIGMWPAFWTYGDIWPVDGEIDILEANGATPKQYTCTYHFGTDPGRDLIRGLEGKINSSDDLTACWHVYEGVWEKDQLTFFLDGKQVHQIKGGYVPDMFTRKQNVILNLAVGGDYLGNPKKENIQLNPMYVDWVRVYVK